MLNPRALQSFVVAADLLHVGRAAERLGIAQPALSQQIRVLEAQIGARLFHRAHRRIELTEAGRVFLPEARRLLAASDRAVQLARQAERGTAGELHIGYSGSVVFEPRLRGLLQRFRAAYPEVTLAMHENAVEPLLDDLQEMRLDIGFLRGPIGVIPAGISQARFVSSPLVVALPVGHRLARQDRIQPQMLSEESFIALPDSAGIGLADSLHRLGERAGFSPIVMLRAGSVASVLGLVGAGLGVSLIPQCSSEFTLSSVVLRELDDPAAVTEVLLLARIDMISRVERRFLDLVGQIEVPHAKTEHGRPRGESEDRGT